MAETAADEADLAVAEEVIVEEEVGFQEEVVIAVDEAVSREVADEVSYTSRKV